MAQITAKAVQELRKKTGLPLMECKKALTEAGGDEDTAITLLRERGQAVLEKRGDRETTFGRFGLYTGLDNAAGGIVELKCESAPVTQNEEFIQLANNLAEALAKTDGIADGEALLDLPSPSKDGMTLREQKDELFNRIREVFNVGRIQKVDGATCGYSHNSGTVSGVLLAVEGGDDDTGRGISMHIAAMRPTVLKVEDLDQAEVAKEREILRAAALAEGKPEKIVDKMVDGRLKNYYAEKVLLEQQYVKAEDKSSVGDFAKSKGMTINSYVHWELGE